MHELSLSSAILETAERHAGGRQVRVVSMRIGHLRQVVPDTLAFYFAIVSGGTVCEGARLEFEHVPAVLTCHACGHAWGVEQPHFRCPDCDSGDVAVTAGQEFEVESIDVESIEAEESACTAPG